MRTMALVVALAVALPGAAVAGGEQKAGAAACEGPGCGPGHEAPPAPPKKVKRRKGAPEVETSKAPEAKGGPAPAGEKKKPDKPCEEVRPCPID